MRLHRLTERRKPALRIPAEVLNPAVAQCMLAIRIRTELPFAIS